MIAVTSSAKGSERPLLLSGRVVLPDRTLAQGAVVVVGDRIVHVGSIRDLPERWRGAETPQGWPADRTLLPGLVDVHCHGGAGGEFGADAGPARRAAEHHLVHGTTTLVGSLVSAPPERLLAGVATCASLVADGVLAGLHLEGPFLSHERRGAQDPSALADVDLGLVERLGAAAGEAGAPWALAQMTHAPERRGAPDLPRALAGLGALTAVGHTDGDAGVVSRALAMARDVAPRGGRPLVTHVFNGMPPLLHRAPGPVGACLAAAARGEAVLEVIADGVHLDALTVRMLFDLVGPEVLCLVSDAMAAAGMAPGRYTLGGLDVDVDGRTARLAEGGSIAGGVATLLETVRFCVAVAGVPLADAVRGASVTPARALGLRDVGALETGRRADLLVVDDDLVLHGVLRSGEWLRQPDTR